MFPSVTIRQALVVYPKIEADLILSHILQQPKEFLFLHPEKKLAKHQQQKFQSFANRRLRGEPLAYIIGYKYFYGLKFHVDKNVLIPRPETEWLVDRAVAIVRSKFRDKKVKRLKVIDVGTGSGNIIIALARKLRLKSVGFFATDISAKALSIARSNAKYHKAKIKFSKSDLLNKVPGKYDILIANLPYVPKKDYQKLKSNLKYEPRIALTQKYDLYRALFDQLDGHLNANAMVLLEIDPTDRPRITKLAKRYPGIKHLKFYRDYHKLWRYAEFYWKLPN